MKSKSTAVSRAAIRRGVNAHNVNERRRALKKEEARRIKGPVQKRLHEQRVARLRSGIERDEKLLAA